MTVTTNTTAYAQRLEHKVALITGGASGIGYACAERFILEGARVALIDIDHESGIRAVASLKNLGGEAIFICADVSDKIDTEQAVSQIINQLGGIDICVCSAGITASPLPIHQLQIDDFDKVMAVNLRAPFLIGQLIANHMIETKKPGSIIHISSVGAVLAVPQAAAYCVSKAGLGMLTKVMAVTLASHNIRVNAVGPGSTNTALTAEAHKMPEVQAGMKARTPLGRFAEASEMAAVTAFLASDDASYITGQTLYADGGRLALNYTMPPT